MLQSPIFCCKYCAKALLCGRKMYQDSAIITHGMFVMQSGLVNKFPFDPLGLDSPTNAEKEIKNGRLAMVRSHPNTTPTTPLYPIPFHPTLFPPYPRCVCMCSNYPLSNNPFLSPSAVSVTHLLEQAKLMLYMYSLCIQPVCVYVNCIRFCCAAQLQTVPFMNTPFFNLCIVGPQQR